MLRRILKYLLRRGPYVSSYAEMVLPPWKNSGIGYLRVYSADIDEELERATLIAYSGKVWRIRSCEPHISSEHGFYILSIEGTP